MNIRKMLEQVKEFYIKFNQKEYLTCGLFPDRYILRTNLLIEEWKEYLQAKNNKDKIEMLDGLMDMYYIHLGTLLEMYKGDIDVITHIKKDYFLDLIFDECFNNGLYPVINKAFTEVHNSNLSKLDKDGKVILREDGKILKSELFFRPNLKQFIKDNH